MKKYTIGLLCWLIDTYCIEKANFQDRITIRKDRVIFSGHWYGNSSNFKNAIIESSNSFFWKFCFSLFPTEMYHYIVQRMFDLITLKEYQYTPSQVQLIRSNVGDYKNSICNHKYSDGRYWECLTNKEQCLVKRYRSWSVTQCLFSMS